MLLKVYQALLADVDDILTLQKEIVEENRFFITTNEEFLANIAEERKKLSAIITHSKKHAVVFVAKSGSKSRWMYNISLIIHIPTSSSW